MARSSGVERGPRGSLSAALPGEIRSVDGRRRVARVDAAHCVPVRHAQQESDHRRVLADVEEHPRDDSIRRE